MNPVDFIRKNIAAQLAAEGFSEQVALGGGWSALTTTAGCHRRAVRDALTTTVCSMRVSGQKGKQRWLSARKRKGQEEKWLRPACSDFVCISAE